MAFVPPLATFSFLGEQETSSNLMAVLDLQLWNVVVNNAAFITGLTAGKPPVTRLSESGVDQV